MFRLLKTFLSMLLCFLFVFAFNACDGDTEKPMGGQEWMDVARIEVAFDDEERLFTSEARKNEIKAAVDEIKTTFSVDIAPSAKRADGEFDMTFVDFLTGEQREVKYRLTPTHLFDLTNDSVYEITTEQYEALREKLTVTPTPGQSL